MIVNRIQQTYSKNSGSTFFAIKEGKSMQFEFGKENAMLRQALLRDWRLLTLDYQVFRIRLLSFREDPKLRLKIEEALKTAKILEVIYRDYLALPTESKRYQVEIKEYEYWLFHHNNPSQVPSPNSEQSAATQIRSWTDFLNFPRLLSVRSRRAFLTLRPFVGGEFLQFAQHFDDATRWFASYQAWLFFIPRLLSNLIFFCKHVIENPWMTQKEKDLGFEARLLAQLDRRWINLANDISWFTSGLISCFVLTGTLGFFAVYLSAITQCLDIIFAIIRVSTERTRFVALEQSYRDLGRIYSGSEHEKEIQAHLSALTYRLNIDRQLLWMALINPVVLTIGACLLCFTSTPILPLIGGVIMVAMTITNYLSTQAIRRQIPNDNQVRRFLLENTKAKDSKIPLINSKSDGYIGEYRDVQSRVEAELGYEESEACIQTHSLSAITT